ncbi:MAG: acyltransferase [Nocardioides sp.]|uniref:acyltransferase family protein n=1 Tax=Nocardioides sp. TaxID=35761 RepID=UPI0039E24904
MTISSEAPLNRGGRFAHVDALRAVAVMLVVVAHAGLDGVVPGGSGVTIFFAISGFVITWVTLRERDRTGGFAPAGFYARRFWKLAPPLLVAVVVPTLVYAVGHAVDWPAVASQVFFVYNWAHLAIDGHIAVLPGSNVVWSLAIEEQFYICFALVWWAAVRWRHAVPGLAALSVAAVLVSTGLRFAYSDGTAATADRIYYGTDTRIDGIALGILLALAIRGGRTAWAGRTWVLVAAGAAFLVSLGVRDALFRDTVRYTVQSVCACLVIAYGFATRPTDAVARLFHAVCGSGPAQLLGRASYSIYLCHYGIISVIPSAWPLAVRVPIGVVAGTGVGIGLYLLVEVPVSTWRRRRTGRAL